MDKITLSDGREAEIMDGTGADLVEATRLAGGDEAIMGMALASRLLRIEGEAMVYEDFLALPLPDVMRVVRKVGQLLGNVTPLVGKES